MIEITLFVCDNAQVYQGKLSVLGAGWSHIAIGAPSALAAILEISSDLTSQTIHATLDCVDADGHPYCPDGSNPLVLQADIEVAKPAGVLAGAPQRLPMAFNFPPIFNTPGRFTWRLTIDETVAATSFEVTPAN